jgi:hypothetical protein
LPTQNTSRYLSANLAFRIFSHHGNVLHLSVIVIHSRRQTETEIPVIENDHDIFRLVPTEQYFGEKIDSGMCSRNQSRKEDKQQRIAEARHRNEDGVLRNVD